jgi:isopentenyldiphosphate isomerase
MTEMLDIYDDNLVHVGVKEREAVHRDGDWHRVFHCWVIGRDAQGQPRIVVQLRAAEKDTFPNRFDVSAAGHYHAGESIRDGVREVEEELGIPVSFEQLIPVGLKIHTARYSSKIDREFSDVFFYVTDCTLSRFDYQRDEVAGLVAFAIDEGIALMAGERDSLQAEAAGLGADVVTLRAGDFVPRPDQYVLKVLLTAKRCLNGEKYLVV